MSGFAGDSMEEQLPHLGGAGHVRAPTLRQRLGRAVRAIRHPMRMLAMAMAASALSFGIARGKAMGAAMIGAALGVVLGELLGRSRARLPSLLAAVLAFGFFGWHLADAVLTSAPAARALGPGTALGMGAVARFFVLGLASTAFLRTLAARRFTFVGLELAAVAAAVAAMFATHRDGVVARPLWLSDWAWQRGYDPVDVLLTIGALSVVLLMLIVLAESEREVSLLSVLAIGGLGALAAMLLDVQGLPQPKPENELGLTEHDVGDPPNPMEEEGNAQGAGQGDPSNEQSGGGGQGQGQQQQGGGGGGQGEQQQGQGGGGQQGEQQQQGGGGGQGEQQQQQGGGGGQGEQQQQQGGGGGQGQQQQQGGGGGGQSQQQQGGQPPPQQPNLEDQSASGNAPAPMAVVLLGDDYSSPLQAFYFRQDVWSHYNGSRLVASKHPDVDRDVFKRFPARRLEAGAAPPEEGHTLVHATVALLVEHAHPFTLDAGVAIGPHGNPNPERFVRAYEFEALAPSYELTSLFGHEVGDPAWSDDAWEAYLRVPEDERYGELAQEILEDVPERVRADGFAQALTIKLWMDEQLTYSTAEKHAGVPDPTGDFLFGNRIGYCVHFAHAAVYMWRSLGIPARVGTGYMVTEDQRQGSTVLITGGDAHAWPELYLDGVGWVILDIAPEQNLDPPGMPADQDLTDLLGEMAREESDEQAPDQPIERERRNFGADLGFGFLALLALVAVGLYLAKAWRRLIPHFATDEHRPRVAFRLALDLLAEAGLSRAHGETREAFARRVADRVPALAGLTSLNVGARLGPPLSEPDPANRPEAWDAGLAALRREIPAVAPPMRRFLGLLNPLTIFDVR